MLREREREGGGERDYNYFSNGSELKAAIICLLRGDSNIIN